MQLSRTLIVPHLHTRGGRLRRQQVKLVDSHHEFELELQLVQVALAGAGGQQRPVRWPRCARCLAAVWLHAERDHRLRTAMDASGRAIRPPFGPPRAVAGGLCDLKRHAIHPTRFPPRRILPPKPAMSAPPSILPVSPITAFPYASQPWAPRAPYHMLPAFYAYPCSPVHPLDGAARQRAVEVPHVHHAQHHGAPVLLQEDLASNLQQP